MAYFIGKEKEEFIPEILLGSGTEGKVYYNKDSNEAVKIFYTFNGYDALMDEDEALKMSKINTEYILLPRRLVYNEKGFFEGYTTPYIDRNINLNNLSRKDISKYSDVKEEFSYAIDKMFEEENYSKFDGEKTYDISLIEDYVNNYLDLDCTNEEWFNKVKEFAISNGFAGSPKEYKKNPEEYKGHVGDICEALRVMVTGRLKSPDLFSIMKILGKENVLKRISLYKNYIND